MSNHNQHNENTPDKPHADTSHLSEEQQSLLTADALGQLEPGSSEATEAAEYAQGNTVPRPTSWQLTQHK